LQIIEHQSFDEERAFYGRRGVTVRECAFDGPADGESAFKECADVAAQRCLFNLRYPFWHDRGVRITDCELTDKCRAALWYTEGAVIERTKMHGIKALRECAEIAIADCDIVSPEFGWSVRGLDMSRCSAEGEYFMLRSSGLRFRSVRLKGKYSFQYAEDAEIDDCDFDTKDAFWHAKNVTVRNSVLKGEYLAWYADGLTLVNCRIEGTQPFCYCKNLRLVDCEMVRTDLAFEKSEVEATVTTPIDSVKNPASGVIRAPAVGELILDDENARGTVLTDA